MIYNGSCHCGKIRFSVEAPEELTVVKCNCSICYIKANHHFIVPERNLRIESGEEFITEYRFNTGRAVHMFCKVCGVQPFYRPRSNPDGFGVSIYAINQSELLQVNWIGFDGENWEEAYAKSDIQKYSRVD